MEKHMPTRTLTSCSTHLLAVAVIFAGFTACNNKTKSTDAPTTELTPPAATAEAPPPPEPASALGTASGTLQMTDFANEADFWAFDKDPSDARRAKAKGQVTEEFHSALAQWKPRNHSLVIYLFIVSLSADEAAKLKTSLVSNSGDIQKRSSTPGQLAAITVEFRSYPPPTGAQSASITIDSRGNSGRSYSATGSADAQVSILPLNALWAQPGRLLPELELRSSGKTHYGGSSFGSSQWQFETRVPVIITSGY
jgi:hypothetical protein